MQSVLEAHRHEVIPLAVNGGLGAALADARLDLVFNTYFGPARRLDQAHVAALLEYSGVSFTGGGASCHYLGLSKPLSKRLFQSAGLPTSRFLLVESAAEAAAWGDELGVRFPAIVKASQEGEGIGIDDRSVVDNRADLVEAAARVIRRFSQPALVEEFLPGREFTAGVIDAEVPWVLPVMEIMVGPGRTFSYAAKSGDTVPEVCPADLQAPLRDAMARLAVRAGRLLGCRDYWRVDFRMDAAGQPLILEVNTLPGLQPGYSDLTRMADPAGIGYDGLVLAIVESATRVSRRPPR